MDWAGIAEMVAPLAPTLGRALGNTLPIPFGGSLGEAAGQAVAGALGVAADPSIVAATIGKTPADVVKAQLSDVETAAASQYAALAASAQAEGAVASAQVAAVGETIRAELIQGEWYQRLWRPTAMFVWIGTWPFQLGLILWQIGTRDAAVVNNLATVITALAAWNAGPAALAGVYSWNRSQEKMAAIGNGH